jgi:hypothetical protein
VLAVTAFELSVIVLVNEARMKNGQTIGTSDDALGRV